MAQECRTRLKDLKMKTHLSGTSGMSRNKGSIRVIQPQPDTDEGTGPGYDEEGKTYNVSLCEAEEQNDQWNYEPPMCEEDSTEDEELDSNY